MNKATFDSMCIDEVGTITEKQFEDLSRWAKANIIHPKIIAGKEYYEIPIHPDSAVGKEIARQKRVAMILDTEYPVPRAEA